MFFVSLIFFLEPPHLNHQLLGPGLRRRPQRRGEPTGRRNFWSSISQRNERMAAHLSLHDRVFRQTINHGCMATWKKSELLWNSQLSSIPAHHCMIRGWKWDTDDTDFLFVEGTHGRRGVENVQNAINQKWSFFFGWLHTVRFQRPLVEASGGSTLLSKLVMRRARDQERIATHYTNYGAQAARTFFFCGENTRTLASDSWAVLFK